jgi:hypothetical protein
MISERKASSSGQKNMHRIIAAGITGGAGRISRHGRPSISPGSSKAPCSPFQIRNGRVEPGGDRLDGNPAAIRIE